MNVYKVDLFSEKGKGERWTVEGASQSAAIGRAFRRSCHNKADSATVTCRIVEKNTTYVQYKRDHPKGE